ncbi:MAG: TrkA C-terminal domain-containing protein [Akkermansiaceae bacterium]|nr:TrkA C-terminal domain-containing protein [Akkermansiaceae bacterium]NNM29353.1 TrkA C-terminal domain-containing protein [Akkermansiaceae bacterium]
MGAILALLVIVLLALLVVQIGTNALVLTGMTLPVARFQAASAFFGTGFTTKEAELVVNHPVRRRIIMHLIVAGNIGLTSAMATLVVTFVGQSDEPMANTLSLLGILVLGVVAVGMFLNLSFIKKPLDAVMRRSLESSGVVRAVDYEVLLKVKQGFCVSDLEILDGHPMAGRSLKDSRPSDRGIVVLGIYHQGGRFEGAPDKDAVINPGDTIMIYGSEEHINAFAAENPDPKEAMDRVDKRAEEVE